MDNLLSRLFFSGLAPRQRQRRFMFMRLISLRGCYVCIGSCRDAIYRVSAQCKKQKHRNPSGIGIQKRAHLEIRWAFCGFYALGCEGLREPPGGPRSGCEARSEANPGRWRPVAKRRGTPKLLERVDRFGGIFPCGDENDP